MGKAEDGGWKLNVLGSDNGRVVRVSTGGGKRR